MERRLIAILAADVVGYSRLMGVNEVETLTALKSHRAELIDARISEHLGRIVKLTGDGMLVEFPSVVNAVACAAGIQREMRLRNEGLPEDRRIEFRIGINLGDVMVDGDDLFGDGVNIAARIESVAKPGGIAVSASVRDHVGNKLDLAFEDTGEQSLKNIEQRIRVYNVQLDAVPAKPSVVTLALPASVKASIAVLPFANLGGDPEQDYFAEGIAEDILTELSRFRDLFVIARNSSFHFKDKGLGIHDIAKALNVEYVVSGSVRRAGNRVRVAAQLAHAATGHEIWADRFDRELEDIFAVQDEVVRTIVVTLEARLGMAIAESAGTRKTPNLAAYECVQLARKFLHIHDAAQAVPYIKRAIDLDPNYAAAHAALSSAGYVEFLETSHADALDKMIVAARKAIALDSTDSRGHALLGMALTYTKQYDLAVSHIQRAVSLNPADTIAIAYHADWLVHIGDAASALTVMNQLLQRDPIPPPWHLEIQAMALMMLERYEEAIKAFAWPVVQFWYVHAYLAICHARLGHPDEARREVTELLILRPGMTISQNDLAEEFLKQEDHDFIVEGLRLAGLPE